MTEAAAIKAGGRARITVLEGFGGCDHQWRRLTIDEKAVNPPDTRLVCVRRCGYALNVHGTKVPFRDGV